MNKKVLVVDDDKNICELLSLYLKKEGYAVVFAYDGSEAINKAKEEKPNIIVLDVMMPVINGWEACKLIRQFTDVPIIMLTALDTLENKVQGLNIGADDYIVKPFILPNLLARIEAVLRRANWQKESHSKQEKTLNKDINIEALTPKEKEVLSYVAKGASNQEIADKLFVRDVTVKTHLNNIFKKLKVSNRTQAVLLAMQIDLIN